MALNATSTPTIRSGRVVACAAGTASASISATRTSTARTRGLLRDLLRDVRRDVRDLLGRQLVLERRHAAAPVLDLLDHGGVVLRARNRGEVRAAVTAVAVGAVAGDAVVREDRRPCGGVALDRRARGGLAAALAAVLRAGALAGCRRRAERAVEREQPEVVAVRSRRQRVAAREERDVLLAVLLEDRRRVVRAGARLEAPEQVTGRGVVRLQLALVAADEDEVAGTSSPCLRSTARGTSSARRPCRSSRRSR